MLRNKHIDYFISITSKYSEMFVLKKEDFLKSFMTYKSEIQNILKDSHRVYNEFLKAKRIIEEKYALLKNTFTNTIKNDSYCT